MEEEVKKRKHGGGRVKKTLIEHRESGWGGTREGSGRKMGRKTRCVSVLVAPSTYEKMKLMKARGVNPSTTMEKAVIDLANLLGIQVDESIDELTD